MVILDGVLVYLATGGGVNGHSGRPSKKRSSRGWSHSSQSGWENITRNCHSREKLSIYREHVVAQITPYVPENYA